MFTHTLNFIFFPLGEKKSSFLHLTLYIYIKKKASFTLEFIDVHRSELAYIFCSVIMTSHSQVQTVAGFVLASS